MLLAQTAAETVIADKGYDAQARVLEPLPAQGKGVVIASRFDECRPPHKLKKRRLALRSRTENGFHCVSGVGAGAGAFSPPALAPSAW